jgi:hypothetical protein
MNFPLNQNPGGNMKAIISLLFFSFLVLAGCSTLTLRPGNFAWPIESVSKVDEKGMIEDKQYNFSLNVKGLLYDETRDSVNISNVTLRIIRDMNGYYFMTASKFKNVYVFEQIEGGLKLTNKILVTQDGIENPAFNQRTPYIQLLNGQNSPISLTKEGILKGENK